MGKRIFDVISSIFGLCLTFPIIIIFSVWVWIESKAFPIYRQRRVGRNNQLFYIYKIRSMVKYADRQSNWTVDNDPRILKIGKFIRNYNIDELPQFLNVLKGEMSLVGPRPETPENFQRFSKEYKGYGKRIQVSPGITGLSQAYGYRGDTCMFRRTVLDLFYVYRNNLKMDLFLIYKTFVKD